MWDIEEDLQDDRVTLFTLFKKDASLPEPAALYFKTAQFLMGLKSTRRQQAIALGVFEVVRDCATTGSLNELTEKCLVSRDPRFAESLQDACRVDPDSILFAFDRVAREMGVRFDDKLKS